MKKILLSIAAVFLTMGAMAQNEVRLTFSRTGTDAGSVTVNVVDENGNAIDGASATITGLSHTFKGTGGNVTESILCPNVNGNTNPTININFTLKGINNFTFENAGLHIHALNGGSNYQDPNDNVVRQWNVQTVIGENTFGSLTNIDIAAGITGANKMWDIEGGATTINGETVIALTITKGTTNSGCFFGLSEIKLVKAEEPEPTPVAAFYHLSGKNLTAAELMEKTEPTYIAIKGLAQGNNVYYNYVTNATNTSQELYDQTNIFVWEPVTAGTKGSYYLRKLNAGYMQTSSPGDFADSKENAIVFTAVKPAEVASGASGSGQFNRDANSDGYITAAGGYDYIVRFVAGSNWLNIGAHVTSAKSPAYTNNGYGTYTIYQICELKGFDANINITIKNTGDVDYATFYSNAPVQMPEGVTAYYVKEDGINDGYITLTPDEDGIIAGNTGVILSTTADEDAQVALTVLGANVAQENGNLLKGTAEDEFIIKEDDKEYYVLADGEIGIGLYVAGNGGDNTTFKNWANKAYLVLPKVNNAASFSFRFGEGTTAIEEVKTENGNVKTVYDLTGRRVEAITAPGIYIVGGKKTLVK